MRLLTTIACLLLVLAATLHASPAPDQLFARAAQAYDAGQFPQAAAAYDSLIQQGYHSAEIYFNLGNAHFRSGDIGHAIWSYRAAQQLAPRDPDITANLTVARLAARDRIESLAPGFWKQTWQSVSTILTFDEGAWLVTGSWCALWLLIAGWLFARSLRRWWETGLRFVGTAWLLASLVFGGRYLEVHNTTHAVVIATETQALSGPGDEFDNVFAGHAGLECTIRGRRNGFLLVKLANGRVGWVLEADLAIVPT